MPIDLESLEDFDPFTVPTIRYIVFMIVRVTLLWTFSDSDVKMSFFMLAWRFLCTNFWLLGHRTGCHVVMYMYVTCYRIVRKFLGRKLSQSSDFRGENIQGLLTCAAKGCHGPKFHRENFCKLLNAKPRHWQEREEGGG